MVPGDTTPCKRSNPRLQQKKEVKEEKIFNSAKNKLKKKKLKQKNLQYTRDITPKGGTSRGAYFSGLPSGQRRYDETSQR